MVSKSRKYYFKKLEAKLVLLHTGIKANSVKEE